MPYNDSYEVANSALCGSSGNLGGSTQWFRDILRYLYPKLLQKALSIFISLLPIFIFAVIGRSADINAGNLQLNNLFDDFILDYSIIYLCVSIFANHMGGIVACKKDETDCPVWFNVLAFMLVLVFLAYYISARTKIISWPPTLNWACLGITLSLTLVGGICKAIKKAGKGNGRE
jgi:hypothetical protein